LRERVLLLVDMPEGVFGNGFTVAVERPLSVLELVSELKRDAASLRVILTGCGAPAV
jgi:hypothetical protein